MTTVHGIPASPGLAQGTAITIGRKELSARRVIRDAEHEVGRFRAAQEIYDAQLLAAYEECVEKTGEAEGEIFKAYRTILHDEAFFKKALARIGNEMINAEAAIMAEVDLLAARFEKVDDPYLKARFDDIANVCRTIVDILCGRQRDIAAEIGAVENAVIVAEDLTPVDTIKMDKSRIRGFITERGGVTSHVAILAKVLGIPALVGAADATVLIESRSTVLLDAIAGTAVVDPDAATFAAFAGKVEQHRVEKEVYTGEAAKSAVTRDGFALSVNVNTGDSESIDAFDERRCDGIGLLRTEFLYMGQTDYPTEEYQLSVYQKIAEAARGKEVIIRTLDIGGDKQLSYMPMPVEDNPFLGYRAIRLCLDRTEIFLTQLRAILRASAFGNVKIMFPMIVTLEELRAAKALVKEAMTQLDGENIEYNKDIEVGIMIETPAAVLLSDKLARECAFFSIGSNDLIQYTAAVDRMNEHVQYLYDSCNISVLRSIVTVSENAAAAGIPWGICGEVASEERLVPFFVALGVSELSVAPSLVGRTKYIVRRCAKSALAVFAAKVADSDTAEDAKALLAEQLAAIKGRG